MYALLARHQTPLLLVAGLAAVAALAGLGSLDVLQVTLVEMLIRVLVVVGLYVFIGNSGVISFGQVGFMCIGAYAAGWATAEPGFKQVMLQGRRSADDERQIGRWARCAGDMGRYHCITSVSISQCQVNAVEADDGSSCYLMSVFCFVRLLWWTGDMSRYCCTLLARPSHDCILLHLRQSCHIAVSILFESES